MLLLEIPECSWSDMREASGRLQGRLCQSGGRTQVHRNVLN